MFAKSLLVAAVSASMAAAYTMPSCWETCFEKYNIQSEGCLCSAPMESVVSSCISVGCPAANSTSSVGTYQGWLSSYCGEGQVTTTAVTTAYTTVCPATESSGWTTSTVSTVISTTAPVAYTWTSTPVVSTYTSSVSSVWTSGAVTTSTWVPTSYVVTMTPGVNTWTGTASVPETWVPATTPATTPATSPVAPVPTSAPWTATGSSVWTGTGTAPATWTGSVPTSTVSPPPYVAGAAGLKVGGVLGAVGAAAALLL